MDHIMENGFMSQMKDCKRLSLDKTDRLLLGLMCMAGDKTSRPEQKSIWFGYGLSAYTMWGILAGYLTYKNVRKRMQKLRSLGLIEDIKEEHRYRRAIKYKPTTLGLFQGLLTKPTSSNMSELQIHKNNILIQTILYRFFEPESIKKFREYYCMIYVARYVRRCCELILDAIENSRQRRRGRTSHLPDSYIDQLVEEEVKNLIFTIVTASTILIEDPDTPNIKSIFPIDALRNDKKFMNTLQKMKSDFDNGYQIIESGL